MREELQYIVFVNVPASIIDLQSHTDGLSQLGAIGCVHVINRTCIAARKIADILNVSLDFLTGKTDVQIDKDTHERILEVSKFTEQDRKHIFSVIDAFIAKRKIQSIL